MKIWGIQPPGGTVGFKVNTSFVSSSPNLCLPVEKSQLFFFFLSLNVTWFSIDFVTEKIRYIFYLYTCHLITKFVGKQTITKLISPKSLNTVILWHLLRHLFMFAYFLSAEWCEFGTGISSADLSHTGIVPMVES